jgi:hypothetical protein
MYNLTTKRATSLLLALVLVFALLPVAAPQNTFAINGSGTADSPYLISNAAELDAVRNNLTAYYKLTNNIAA